MAPIQSHSSSFVEKNIEAKSSKTSSISSVNMTRTATSNNTKVSTCDSNSRNQISHRDKEVTVPITSRGNFYHDSFFEDRRQQFDSAVRDMLDMWDSRSCIDDDLLSYRRMRELNLKEENQALSISQDQKSHQVVIDVRDFMEGDVKVKVVDDNELVVEGSIEKRQDGSLSKKRFSRRFSFPGHVSEEAVLASISADGVLTITVPKKVDLQNERQSKTIQVMASNGKSEAHTNTQTSKHNLDKKKETIETSFKENSHDDVSKETMKDKIFISHFLPISKKGLFFHDTFFEDSRKEFETAIDQVLREWGENCSTNDQMTTYRNLRKHKLREENQAVALSEDHQCHKIVVDVQDFKEGDVKVEVMNKNELIIKGQIEFRQDGSISMKSFFRRFLFPGLVSGETVSSVMSSDGILTVTVAKTNEDSADATKHTMSKTSQSKILNTQEKQTSEKVAKLESQYQFSKSKKVSTEKTEETSLKEKAAIIQKLHQNVDSHAETLDDSIRSDKWLTIAPKGLFFSDSFFEDFRKDFETAIAEVLKRHSIKEADNDQFSCYRSLRERELKDETQAMKTTEDQNEYKVVLDVRDFLSEDIKVKVEDDKEVVVEGHVEKNDGTFRSTKSFCRRFNFPAEVNVQAITSAMSSDGVLTITVPKKTKN